MKGKNKHFSFRGKYFVLLVLILYAGLALADRSSFLLALSKGTIIFLKILPIFTLVIIFTAVLNYALRPQQIVDHLGQKSGMTGWCYALLAGVISHGPLYAWYPMLEDLRSHGLRDRLLVTFFFARAIKLPLLPLMVDYFGLVFTISLSLYILIGALLQGIAFEAVYNHKTG